MVRLVLIVGCVVSLVVAGACTSSATVAGTPSSSTSRGAMTSSPARRPSSHAAHPAASTPSSTAASTAASTSSSSSDTRAIGLAQRVFNSMTLSQRVGQLLMVDCPSSGVTASTREAITRWHAGSVILDGNSSAGVERIRTVTGRLQRLAPRRARLFIATDQEGGYVQRLSGPGFSSIPSAVQQSAERPAVVWSDWKAWGGELGSAGVNVDLAPVLDTVPLGDRTNPPIGELQREYGRTPDQVASFGVAAARGLAAGGIAATVKHFPGLGRVSGNTDTTSGVTDAVTTRHDPYLRPFQAAVRAHVPFVMVSSAVYARIDPRTPAIFSRTIVTGMLRHDLGFHGVIITDDIGAAAQIAGVPAGQRAVRFVQAGGTMVLTVAPATVAPMASQLLARARSDAAFRELVNAAALVVLKAKQAHGLLRA